MDSINGAATKDSDRNERGQFILGHKGNGGRPKGARSILTTRFLDDLKDTWEAHGKTALERCAMMEPMGFVRVCASIIPKQIDATVTADPELTELIGEAASFATAFRRLAELVGSELTPEQVPLIEAQAIEAETED